MGQNKVHLFSVCGQIELVKILNVSGQIRRHHEKNTAREPLLNNAFLLEITYLKVQFLKLYTRKVRKIEFLVNLRTINIFEWTCIGEEVLGNC